MASFLVWVCFLLCNLVTGLDLPECLDNAQCDEIKNCFDDITTQEKLDDLIAQCRGDPECVGFDYGGEAVSFCQCTGLKLLDFDRAATIDSEGFQACPLFNTTTTTTEASTMAPTTAPTDAPNEAPVTPAPAIEAQAPVETPDSTTAGENGRSAAPSTDGNTGLPEKQTGGLVPQGSMPGQLEEAERLGQATVLDDLSVSFTKTISTVHGSATPAWVGCFSIISAMLLVLAVVFRPRRSELSQESLTVPEE